MFCRPCMLCGYRLSEIMPDGDAANSGCCDVAESDLGSGSRAEPRGARSGVLPLEVDVGKGR